MTSVANEPTVAFDGNKFYWRTRNVVDVVIVQHFLNLVYEVIVYEPTFDKEAPRLYINTDALMASIDQGEIDNKLSFARRNGIPLTDKFIQSVRNDVISEFVLARLLIKDMDRESKTFSVELQTQSGVDLLRPAPASLFPYQTRHFCVLKKDQIDQALTVLQQETKALRDTTENAATLAGLTVRERWRIPLVMGKVLRGQRLRKPDAKIFSHVQANMKTDEDATRMKAVLHVDASRARTAHAGKPSRLPKPLTRGNSSLFTATASSLHKAASASNLNRSENSSSHHKSVHTKRSNRTGTATKATLTRKKSKLKVSGATADAVGEVPDSNFKRLMSGLSQLGATLRVNLGLQSTSTTKIKSSSPHTPTVQYSAQTGLSTSQDEDPPVCTAGPTPCAADDLTPVNAGEQSMSFDDAMADMQAGVVQRGHEAQTPQELQLVSHEAADVDEEVDSQEGDEAAIKAKPSKRPSMLAPFLQAITAGINSSFGSAITMSQKGGGEKTPGSQRASFLHTGLSLWGSTKSKVVPGE